MRPQAHRAALRRIAFRLGLAVALFVGMGLLAAGLPAGTFDARTALGATLLTGALTATMTMLRRPRARVTTPRAPRHFVRAI